MKTYATLLFIGVLTVPVSSVALAGCFDACGACDPSYCDSPRHRIERRMAYDRPIQVAPVILEPEDEYPYSDTIAPVPWDDDADQAFQRALIAEALKRCQVAIDVEALRIRQAANAKINIDAHLGEQSTRLRPVEPSASSKGQPPDAIRSGPVCRISVTARELVVDRADGAIIYYESSLPRKQKLR